MVGGATELIQEYLFAHSGHGLQDLHQGLTHLDATPITILIEGQVAKTVFKVVLSLLHEIGLCSTLPGFRQSSNFFFLTAQGFTVLAAFAQKGRSLGFESSRISSSEGLNRPR